MKIEGRKKKKKKKTKKFFPTINQNEWRSMMGVNGEVGKGEKGVRKQVVITT